MKVHTLIQIIRELQCDMISHQYDIFLKEIPRNSMESITNIANLENTYNHRISITSECIFHIDHSFFQNIITNEFQGGGINIENAAQISSISTLYQRCSSTNFGGAFFFGAEVCKVSKCCSVECYHTVKKNWNLGGGGYIQSSSKACHEYSSIIHCAPEDALKYGAISSFGIEGGIVTVENVNSTKGSIHGYLIRNYLEGTALKYINLESVDVSLLYFYSGVTVNVSMANLFEQAKGFSAIYCSSASAQLDNIVFYKNDLDLSTNNGKISIQNSITDKSSLWSGAINCQTNAQSVESIALTIQRCEYLEKQSKYSEKYRILPKIIGILSLFS